eukprot:CAMPEP_0170551198 /NCGR_PEP_ID=MMETSP0211-20121228/9226_1 /TAXON_ID=311385 /ORGANISM="Pseudokeronopsis sp., Strain OXSARD2" /LENGTH=54 /DNA_ID=CAMNT_0010858219 /DNA_START=151 /DNA_END=312 /DNA_ORIENTATION=+
MLSINKIDLKKLQKKDEKSKVEKKDEESQKFMLSLKDTESFLKNLNEDRAPKRV